MLEPIDLRARYGDDLDLEDAYEFVHSRMQVALSAAGRPPRPALPMSRIVRSIAVARDADTAWRLVGDLDRYDDVLVGITRWEPPGRAGTGS